MIVGIDDELQLTDQHYFFQRLKIEADVDERAIKRAYARELKLIDQETNPGGFQELREAYDAALFWLRHERAVHLPDQAVDPFEEIGRAAEELQLHRPPARAGIVAHSPAPANTEPEVDAETLAQEVFAEFEVRCANLGDMQLPASWKRELQASLADARLIHIGTRHAFEQRIANLLAEGWRPGHEQLLVAATNAFEWESDRRRVQALGMAGYTLHFAIEQRAMYDLQSDDACEQQRQLIVRLRDPAPPSTSELIDLMPVLGAVEARFPAWLSLIADADNISRWHNLNHSVPSWRRFLRRRDFSFPVWPVVVALLVLLRVFYSFSPFGDSDATPQVIAAQHHVIGHGFLGKDEYEKAVASFDKAVAADPDNASAYAGRAMSLAFLSEKVRALADLEKLESLEPLNPLLYRTRGLLARNDGRDRDAAAAFTRALELDPENSWTLMRRGYSYRAIGELDKALKDADRVLEIEPDWLTGRVLRARVLVDRKETVKAKAEAEAMLLGVNKNGGEAYRFAALIYQESGDRQGAVAVLDKAVAASPVPATFLNRAHARPLADVAARRTDIEAALKLEPKHVWGLNSLVQLELQARQWGDVIKAANRAMEQESMKGYTHSLLTSRGIGHAKRGDMQKANQDFEAARLAAKVPVELNNMCYAMAVHNVALQTALENCDASLEQEPNAGHTLDSKALTLMRLKRFTEALAVYDAAMKVYGKSTDALYGRGVVKHRLGNKHGGREDTKAALALDPEIGAHFARMGLVP